MSDAAEVAAALAAARASGDPDALAAALVDHASVRLDRGELAAALLELDEAAAIHAVAGRPQAQAKCLHFSATVCRVMTDFAEADVRARRAEGLAAPATPTMVAAIMEQAEVAVLRGAHGDAADLYGRALAEGRAAGLVPDEQARLQRKRGKILAVAERFADAAAAIREARALHDGTGNAAEARRAAVELAVVQIQAGDAEASALTIAEALAAAHAADDHHVAADLELLAAGHAAASRAFDEALACARRARTHALAATAPLSYVSAVVTIAEVADAVGDRDSAYEALASGWVTTGDVLGTDAARELFEPRLEALRSAWGGAAFVRVRDAYNDRRRAVLGADRG